MEKCNINELEKKIKKKMNECEKRSKNWEEKIQAYTDRMKLAENDEDIQIYKFERQKCIGKKNELLAVADFCKDCLKYFK